MAEVVSAGKTCVGSVGSIVVEVSDRSGSCVGRRSSADEEALDADGDPDDEANDGDQHFTLFDELGL